MKLTAAQLAAMQDDYFMECNDCARKPGYPTLCVPCLHNCDLIIRLYQRTNRQSWFKKLWKGIFDR